MLGVLARMGGKARAKQLGYGGPGVNNAVLLRGLLPIIQFFKARLTVAPVDRYPECTGGIAGSKCED